MSKSGFRESYLSTDRLSHERRLPVVAFPLFSSWLPAFSFQGTILQSLAAANDYDFTRLSFVGTAATCLGLWIAPYSDKPLGTLLRKQMNSTFDLIAGAETYEIWAPYWPQHGDIWPEVNKATKYVASNTITSAGWQPSVILNEDIVEKVAHIKQQEGPDLHVWGSGNLIQTLLKHGLVDVF